MNIFKPKRIPPPSYRPPLEAAEIIQLFSQDGALIAATPAEDED
jgi:hypothetical protein